VAFFISGRVMRYICVATVRKEHEEWSPHQPEVFIGTIKDDEHPTRIAYRGVSDINAELRVEDHKFEITGVAWLRIEDFERLLIGMLDGFMTLGPVEPVEDYRERLSSLEALLDRYSAKVYERLDPAEEEEPNDSRSFIEGTCAGEAVVSAP
jgi:hypothetical protein